MNAHSTAAPPDGLRALSIVLVVALGLRAVWIAIADVDITGGLYFDMTWYHGIGQRVAAGLGITRASGAPTAEWPPGYPLLLGAVFKLTGGSVPAAQLVGAGVATACCALVYVLGRRLASARVGLVAAALVALSPGDIYYAPLLLAEAPFAAALVGTCALFAASEGRCGDGPPAARDCFVIGLALGATTLLRGASAAFVVVFATVWLARGLSARATAFAATIVCVGFLAALLPWMARNQISMGRPILLSTSLGRTLSHAHSPVESGGRSLAELRYRMDIWQRFEDVPQPQREIEINRAFTRDALEHVAGHPLEEVALVPVRLVNLYRHDHAALEWGRPHATPGATSGPRRPLLDGVPDAVFERAADGYFYLVLIAAALGMVRIVRSGNRTALLIPLAVAYFTLLHTTAFPGEPRYRYPAGPFIALAAAWAFVEARRSLPTGDENDGSAAGAPS